MLVVAGLSVKIVTVHPDESLYSEACISSSEPISSIVSILTFLWLLILGNIKIGGALAADELLLLLLLLLLSAIGSACSAMSLNDMCNAMPALHLLAMHQEKASPLHQTG